MLKGTSRCEAFSDGVFAIAATLLVLDIRLPHADVDGRLWATLEALWPSYLAFALSFFVIVVAWMMHHDLMRLIRAVNRRFLLANALLLMYVTFVPFPTRVLADHLLGTDAGAAVTFYCGTFVFGSTAMILLIDSVVHGQLFRPEVDAQFIRRYRRAAGVGLLINIAATHSGVSGLASVGTGAHFCCPRRLATFPGGHDAFSSRSGGRPQPVECTSSATPLRPRVTPHSFLESRGIVMRDSLWLIALVCTCVVARAQQAAATHQPKGAEVDRGLYLVTLGGCNDCHSPKIVTPRGPQPDPARLLSGHPANAPVPTLPAGVLGPDKWGAVLTPDGTAWMGPWGTSFAANLTPDPTGIGGRAPEIFMNAMRTGKHLGAGRPILPPMPWAPLGKLTDGDLRAMFAYLWTLKPISNAVPEPVPLAGASAAKK